MTAPLTEKEFLKHVNTTFRVNLASTGKAELELVEVKSYAASAGDQGGMERFSVYFQGPADLLLPQRTYPIEHDEMGQFDLFLVPIARNQNKCRYEAVFNYFK
jgi:hypothetical protein